MIRPIPVFHILQDLTGIAFWGLLLCAVWAFLQTKY